MICTQLNYKSSELSRFKHHVFYCCITRAPPCKTSSNRSEMLEDHVEEAKSDKITPSL